MELRILVQAFTNEELLNLLEDVNRELAIRGVRSTGRNYHWMGNEMRYDPQDLQNMIDSIPQNS